MPKVTVILTSYNHEKFICEAIESVINQTFTDFELIIVDDCSEDNSWNLISEYRDSRIKAYRNDKRYGPVHGVNNAIFNLSKGKYIAIHHSDDVWMPEKLEKQISVLEGDSNLGAVFTNAEIITSNGTKLQDHNHFYHNKFEQGNRSKDDWLRTFFENGNCLCHPSVLIKKTVYLACGGYSGLLAQLPDFEMWVRLCFNYEIYVIQEQLVKFRILVNEHNTSANTYVSRVRNPIEYQYVLDTFLRNLDRNNIFKIFPDFSQYSFVKETNISYVFFKILLQLKSSGVERLYAINLLHKIFSSPEKIRNFEGIHEAPDLEFTKLTGLYDIFNEQLAYGIKDIKETDLRILAIRYQEDIKSLKSLNERLEKKYQSLLKTKHYQYKIFRLLSKAINPSFRAKKIWKIQTRFFVLLKNSFIMSPPNIIKILYRLSKSLLSVTPCDAKKTFYREEHLHNIMNGAFDSHLKLYGNEKLIFYDKNLGQKGIGVKELMILDHNGGGGTNIYSKQLLETYLNDGYAVTRVYSYYGFIFGVRIFQGKMFFFDFEDFDKLSLVASKIKVSKIIVNSLYGFIDIPKVSSKLIALTKSLNAQLELKFHDYHALCPSPHLINSDGRYCGVPQDKKICSTCLQSNNSWYHEWIPMNDRAIKIDEWRRPFLELLKTANEATIFDSSCSQILSKGFNLDKIKIKLKPHASNYCLSLRQPLINSDKIHIGFIGAFSAAKGSDIIKNIISYSEDRMNLPITVIGKVYEKMPSNIDYRGEYSLDNLADLVELSGVNVIFFASIIPETFSYALTECMQMQLPILSFDIGAQSNRLKDYKFGKVIPLNSKPSFIVYSLKTLFEFHKEQNLACSSTPQ